MPLRDHARRKGGDRQRRAPPVSARRRSTHWQDLARPWSCLTESSRRRQIECCRSPNDRPIGLPVLPGTIPESDASEPDDPEILVNCAGKSGVGEPHSSRSPKELKVRDDLHGQRARTYGSVPLKFARRLVAANRGGRIVNVTLSSAFVRSLLRSTALRSGACRSRRAPQPPNSVHMVLTSNAVAPGLTARPCRVKRRTIRRCKRQPRAGNSPTSWVATQTPWM